MGKPKAPAPPDPKETSAASTSTNVGTAIANSQMNNVDQVTPDGTIKYSTTGTYKWTDPYTGRTYDIPKTTATTELSAQQQAIKDQTDAASLNLGGIANDQSAFLKDYLGKPVDLSNDAVEGRLMELGSKRLQPLLDQRRASNETDLINRGIRPGSDNYASAQNTLNQGENDAFNQLLLTGRQQSVQEALTERNQPINEISALLSGSQVSMPQAAGYNTSTIPTTDVAGLINANYDQKLQQWQQKNAQSQNILGGLFGLGSAIISDRRMKTDIKEVGKTSDGQKIYSYRYKTGGPVHIGLMAQEVEKAKPDAVVTLPTGIKAVDYDKALEGAV